MERFNEYWELLSETRNSIAKELITYYKTLNDTEDGVPLSRISCSFLRKNFHDNPYPTCQLLRLLASSKLTNKNNAIHQISNAGFTDFFAGYGREKEHQCYNILANSAVSVQVYLQHLSAISSEIGKQNLSLELCVLALLSRRSFKLLKATLGQQEIPWKQEYLFSTFEKKEHFLLSLAERKQHFIQLHPYLEMIHAISEVNERGSLSCVCDAANVHITGLEVYALELQRNQMVHSFLLAVDATVNVAELSKHASVLTLIANQELSAYQYTTVVDIIRQNVAFLQRMSLLRGSECPTVREEFIAKYVYAVEALFQIIICNTKPGDTASAVHGKLNFLKSIMKDVESMSEFVEIMESLLTLIFLRFEYIFGENSPGGFVCTIALLRTLVATLKPVVVSRKHSPHYTELTEELKIRFDAVLDLLNDACWRLTVIDCDIPNTQVNVRLSDAHINATVGYANSDNASMDGKEMSRSFDSMETGRPRKYCTLPKQKQSKRRQSSQCSSNSGSNMQHSFPFISKESMAAKDMDASFTKRRYTFTKLFGTPEDLATLCLCNSNMAEAKALIKQHDLWETATGRTVDYLAHLETAKSCLVGLVEKYEQAQEDLRRSDATPIDDIRLKTAVGFEMSKVLSTIEQFLIAHKLNISETVGAIMDKFAAKYSFLSVYTSATVNFSQALDIILDLPFKLKQNINVYNFILKHVDESNAAHANYVAFFSRMVDSMQAFKSVFNNKSLTMSDVLTRELCPLDSKDVISYLKKRKYVCDIQKTSDKWLHTDYEVPYKSLTKLKRFVQKLDDILRLYHSGPSPAREVVVPPAITINASTLLQQLIVEKQTPLDVLEPMAANISVSLTHVLASALVDVADNRLSYKDEAIGSFLEKRNALLGSVCSDFIDSQLLFSNLQHVYGIEQLTTGGNSMTARILRMDDLLLSLVEVEPQNYSQHLRLLQCITEGTHRKHQTAINTIIDSAIAGISLTNEAAVQLVLLAVKDIGKSAQLLSNSIDHFESPVRWLNFADHVLTASKQSDTDDCSLSELRHMALQIQTYRDIAQLLNIDDWRTVKTTSDENKTVLLHQLVTEGHYDLCYQWVTMHPLDEESNSVMDIFTTATCRSSTPAQIRALFRIVETLPVTKVIQLYETILFGIKNEFVISYVVDYLERHGSNGKLYQKFRISLSIFKNLPPDEIGKLWSLVSRPLLIVEQYLMNSKLELIAIMMDSLRPHLVDVVCKLCYEHREYIRDLHGTASPSVDLSATHDELSITHECVDCLFRIYAAKALEYKIFSDTGYSDNSLNHHSTSSLDSLCDAFVMPKKVPSRESWVKDEDATLCMCCRRTAFSMLNRRHHCRRCGRVVCHSCSKQKQRLAEQYDQVAVRVCDDCYRQLNSENNTPTPASTVTRSVASDCSDWQLTGNVRYDSIIRDEYIYEYSPSTSQCLAICKLHSSNEEIANFLLYHCAKLESLLRPMQPGYPNPEIDYALVARMLLNLTLAAKVRGLHIPEVEKMKEHAEIILSIVKNDCESLLLGESMSNGNLRKLRDALVKAEKWALALELSLKCGFSVSGVMAAWGMTSLKAGCYETAREKFSHCLQRVSPHIQNTAIMQLIETPDFKLTRFQDEQAIKRPTKSPPLLLEILNALELTTRSLRPEVLARARSSVILTSSTQRIKDTLPLHEPALNILNTLANLKHIVNGNHSDFLLERRSMHQAAGLPSDGAQDGLNCIMTTRFFEESMYYLLSYGSHQNVVEFLIKCHQTRSALKYTFTQNVDPEIFLQCIVLPFLKNGHLKEIVRLLISTDETLVIWKDYIVYTCRYLEVNGMLNSLYNLQLLLEDPIRASMTCVRFYSMGCSNFTDLEANTLHLKASVSHLQNELEICNWEELNLDAGRRKDSRKSLLMKMDAKALNNHINTILLQLEITRFLASCEAKGKDTMRILSQMFSNCTTVPTLFATTHEKQQLAFLTLVCGQNVEEGFGISYRVIQDYNLNCSRVYVLTAKYLINYCEVENVEKLLVAIISNNSESLGNASVCDEIIKSSVETAMAATHGGTTVTKLALESLIKRTASVGIKIHCYIVTNQLKGAYLLANKNNRIGDIRRILRQAEVLNQVHVKRLCEARLTALKK